MLYKYWILYYRFFSKVNYVIEFDTTSSVHLLLQSSKGSRCSKLLESGHDQNTNVEFNKS